MSTYKPTMDRIQYVDDATQEVFYVDDLEACEVGEFMLLDGSAYKNYWMPKIKAYDDADGSDVPIGIATKKVPVKLTSSDDLYRVAVTRDHERAIGLMKAGRLYMKNVGASTVNPGEEIAACVTGFMKDDGTSTAIGRAEQKIAAGKWGLIHVILQ